MTEMEMSNSLARELEIISQKLKEGYYITENGKFQTAVYQEIRIFLSGHEKAVKKLITKTVQSVAEEVGRQIGGPGPKADMSEKE